MSNSKSLLWRGFDKVERAVGRPLEDVVASRRYADVMVRSRKVKQAVGGLPGRVVRGGLSGVLRAVNVPTGSDVQRLSRQLAALTGEVRALSRTPQDAVPPAALEEGSGDVESTPTKAGAPKRKAVRGAP